MIQTISNLCHIKINIKNAITLKYSLTVISSSPLFLLAGSSDIFGTGALWPLIHAVALF